MRIDSHQHFWKFDPIRDTWIDDSMNQIRRDFLPVDLLPILKEQKIDGTVAVQVDQSLEETRFLLELAAKNEFIKGVVGWIDLQASDIDEKLSDLSNENKLCGFRHIVQSEPDDKFLIRERFLRGVSYLREYGFTYDILIYPHQIPAAIELVHQLPDQKFVLDHIAKPRIKDGVIEPWASQIRELGSAKSVYCKVSGIITEANHKSWKEHEIRPYLDVVFDAFDRGRIMFGSDWPVCLLAGSYSQVMKLIENYISTYEKDVEEKIFGKNTIEFYGIKPGI